MGTSVCAVVLAGGAGRRVGGRDKGLIAWQGRLLVDHAVARLRDAAIAHIAISANRNLEHYRAYGPVLADEVGGYPGPLAGIVRALRWCPTTWLFTVPVDVPDWPASLPSALQMRAQETGSACAVATHAGGREPLFALYNRSCTEALARRLESSERSVRGAQDALACVEVPAPQGYAFANLNELPA